MRLITGVGLLILLSACVDDNAASQPPLTSANRVVEKTVTIPPPSLAMMVQLSSETNPALAKAYEAYQKTGEAKTIETEQFIQFPYNTGSQPVIAASVLELTVISLEAGEQVNSVSSGDPLRWSYSLVYSNNGALRQAHVLIKPSKPNISTDFFITTDRRSYLLKLVATTTGKYAREVRFWYPQTLENNWEKYNAEKQQDTAVVAELPNIDVNHLNFNYQLGVNGQTPPWAPQRVFDDGVHTYIQLPPKTAADDLPALFIQNGNQQEMVNYRVKMPYFVVDKLFSTAVLISDVGSHQQRVTIINNNPRGE